MGTEALVMQQVSFRRHMRDFSVEQKPNRRVWRGAIKMVVFFEEEQKRPLPLYEVPEDILGEPVK